MTARTRPRRQAVRTRRRAMYLHALWQEPAPRPAWQEWTVAGALAVAFCVFLASGVAS